MQINEILDRFEGVRESGANKYSTRCPGPGHSRGDRRNSLTIYVNQTPHGRKIRFYCLQDDHEVIRDAAGLTERDLWIDLDGKSTYQPSENNPSHKRKRTTDVWEKYQSPGQKPSPEALYVYRNASGEVMAYKHRTKKKSFFWTPELPILYNLDRLSNLPPEEPVYFVENETVAESLGDNKVGICFPDKRYDSIIRAQGSDEFWKLLNGRKIAIVKSPEDKRLWLNRDFLDLIKHFFKDMKVVEKRLPTKPEEKCSYPYRNADGMLMATKTVNEKGIGSWTPEIPVVYHLDRLVKADKNIPLYIVEGEKDADRLTSLGRLSVCLPHGASAQVEKLRNSKEFWDACKGRIIVACGDYDNPGIKYSRALGKLFSGHAKGVYCLRWVELAPESCFSRHEIRNGKKIRVHYGAGYDVSDFLDTHGPDAMDEIVRYLKESLKNA